MRPLLQVESALLREKSAELPPEMTRLDSVKLALPAFVNLTRRVAEAS